MPDGDQWLRLALSRPAEALEGAAGLLATGAEARTESIARQMRVIVWRDAGDFDAALAEARRAVRAAQASGDRERVTDVRATLGVVLLMSGRPAAGLAALDAAVAASTGRLAGRVLARRGLELARLG